MRYGYDSWSVLWYVRLGSYKRELMISWSSDESRFNIITSVGDNSTFTNYRIREHFNIFINTRSRIFLRFGVWGSYRLRVLK